MNTSGELGAGDIPGFRPIIKFIKGEKREKRKRGFGGGWGSRVGGIVSDVGEEV